MSSGPKNVTSTTSSEPPAWAVPGLQQAMGESQSGLNTTNLGFQQQTGLSPGQATGQGLGDLFNRGQSGSRLQGTAEGLTQATMDGRFLGPDSNPFLRDTFNRAADLTRGRLDTEFAGSGRDLGASLPARSEELQTLASNIYGGNYQQERDRQANSVSNVGDFQNMDFQNIQAMIDSGSLPIDQFINRLGGVIPGAGGVTQSTQPVFRTGLF